MKQRILKSKWVHDLHTMSLWDKLQWVIFMSKWKNPSFQQLLEKMIFFIFAIIIKILKFKYNRRKIKNCILKQVFEIT